MQFQRHFPKINVSQYQNIMFILLWSAMRSTLLTQKLQKTDVKKWYQIFVIVYQILVKDLYIFVDKLKTN